MLCAVARLHRSERAKPRALVDGAGRLGLSAESLFAVECESIKELSERPWIRNCICTGATRRADAYCANDQYVFSHRTLAIVRRPGCARFSRIHTNGSRAGFSECAT